MNREEFLDLDREGWWLVEPSEDSALNDLRDHLGAALGYEGDRDWYTKRESLEALWSVVEARPDLVAQLDDASDPDRRKAWVDTLVQTKAADQSSATVEEEAEETAAPVNQPAAEAAAAPLEAPAAPRKSIFGKKSDEGSASEPEPAASETQASVASAQPAEHGSLFGRKGDDDAPATDEAPVNEPLAAPVEHVDVEELKKEVSSLLESPNIQLNAEDLDELAADPEFDQKLAEATAALEAELAAGGDEDEWDDEEEEEEEMEPVEG